MRSQPFIQSPKRISRHVYKMLLLSRHLPPKSDLIDSEASMRSFEKRKPLTDLTNAPSLSGSSATAGDFTNIGKPNHVVGINCIPAEKTKRIRGKSKMQGENTAQKRTFSVPHQKSAKKQRCKTSKNMDEQVSLLPQDYVEQQRAYFAEIDAFELPEEEVSISDLE